MNWKDEIISQLISFRDCDKFEVYKDRQPAVENSSEEDKKQINEEINFCCNELLSSLNNDAPQEKELFTIVRSSKAQIEDMMLDTEDREFCYELYAILGDILGIDVEDHSITIEQILMQQIQRLMEKGGIRPEDLPPGIFGK
jgi:hypothetical protein